MNAKLMTSGGTVSPPGGSVHDPVEKPLPLLIRERAHPDHLGHQEPPRRRPSQEGEIRVAGLFLHRLDVVPLAVGGRLQQRRVLSHRCQDGGDHVSRRRQGLSEHLELRNQVSLIGRGIERRQVLLETIPRGLDLMVQQRLDHGLLGAELVSKAALADTAFPGDRIECESRRPVPLQDRRSRRNRCLARPARTLRVFHPSALCPIGWHSKQTSRSDRGVMPAPCPAKRQRCSRGTPSHPASFPPGAGGRLMRQHALTSDWNGTKRLHHHDVSLTLNFKDWVWVADRLKRLFSGNSGTTTGLAR